MKSKITTSVRPSGSGPEHQIKTSFSIVSKKLYSLLLLLTTISGFANIPPIASPPDTYVCAGNTFDLTIVDPQILDGLDPDLYSVSYYQTMSDASIGINPILTPTAYLPLSSQYVYIRVQEDANPSNFAVASWLFISQSPPTAAINGFSTICGGNEVTVAFQGSGGGEPFTFTYTVNGGPVQTIITPFNLNGVGVNLPTMASGTYDIDLISVTTAAGCSNTIHVLHHIDIIPGTVAGAAQDLSIEQIPFTGTAVFDLTINEASLSNGNVGATVSYYTTAADAQAAVNPIVDPTAFLGSNGQEIWANVSMGNQCDGIRSFRLFITNPDIVFIPDANFKNGLVTSDFANSVAQDLTHNYTPIDINHDGEIQYSEAANISLLNVSQRDIADLTGLEAFINVQYLNVGYNAPLTSIPTTALPLLSDLTASHCNLTTLDLSNNHELTYLTCEYNNLTSLDFSQSSLMTFIHCQNNHLTTLNLTGLTLLNNLWASENNLTSLNTSDLDSIIYFNVGLNSLTSLDLTGMTTVQELIIASNQIDSINTAGCVNLTNLRCNSNQMTYLEVSESPLQNLDCSENTLINLDLSQNNELCSLNCAANNNMVTLNIKNGVDSCYTNYNVLFITNNLQQFCCDDNEVTYFKNYFLTHQGIDVNVNSYCSFTPGGDYNTISANVKFDANNDGCDAGDNVYANLRLNINDGTNSGAAFTGTNGNAQFFTQAGNFTITPTVENPAWFTISPASVMIPFANTNNNTANQDFCITANGGHPDLEVVFAPINTARPGFNAVYKLVYRNKGNQTMSGSISLTYEDAVMDFTSSEVPPTTQAPGVLNYDFTNIAPFESRSFYLYFHVNAPTNVPAVNIGDILDFQAVISSTGGDDNPSDNTFPFHQTVVGSYDPNDIVCLEGNIVSPVEIGNYLHYVINFENTGNADAENIVVREVIDATQFDISTLQLLNSSAAVTTRLTGNLAEFIFPSINLHSGGHGNILLKIRSNNTLTEGDMVSKRANIYFDYNFPVETLPENTVFQLLSNPDVNIDASVSIYPNPTKGLINIECNNNIKSVQLYDVQGRILQTNVVNENQASLDISTQSKGVYFIKIISDNGMKVQKIVKD